MPIPFVWGLYGDGEYQTFDTTAAFVESVRERRIILYAHNGGKFDFIYLLPYIGETRVQIINSRIVSMMLGKCELRDSYAIIPEPLKNFGSKKEIALWKLEREHRTAHREEIEAYLHQDCKGLFDAVIYYRTVAGTKRTIASNALHFAKVKLGIDMGRSNSTFDEEYRRYFFGGRTECFNAGTHRNIKILDIHSAYPFAMTHHHATGTLFKRQNDLRNMTREQVQRAFIVIECTSDGAFPLRAKSGELFFPHEYNEFHVTGWEYIAAKELGLIRDEKIHSVSHTDDTITFKPYVDHWYAQKASFDKKTQPMEYTVSKIMMNSLYGKAAQNMVNYYDYKIVKAGSFLCNAPVAKNDTDCALCDLKLADHGWTLECEYDAHEIHRREALWRYKFQYGDEWRARKLFNNVATGASITGFTRAHLLRAIRAVGVEHVIYCDTDSIICSDKASVEKLTISPDIGAWELEDDCAPVGHFAGKKMYAITLSTGKKKTATKGVRLSPEQVQSVSEGGVVHWKNEAPSLSFRNFSEFQKASKIDTGKLDGDLLRKLFLVREIRQTVKSRH